MRVLFPIMAALFFFPTLAQAEFSVNAGRTPDAGEGPVGADATYLDYATAHETALSGDLVNYPGVTFAEGGLAGTYNVGVAFSWPDATTDATKQAFNRPNLGNYDLFWTTWIGTDIRDTNGGIAGGDRLVLSLTGLEPNTNFVFTSYHFDTDNQAGTFLVDQTPTASETAVSPFAKPRANAGAGGVDATLTPWIDNAYSFDVTSDASGNLDITFTQNSGTWVSINGFDLEAVATTGGVLLGDVDISGVVDFGDIPAFIALLQAGGFQLEADCDESGTVDFGDIPAFITILMGG